MKLSKRLGQPKYRWAIAGLVVVLIALAGVHLIAGGHAAAPYSSAEAEGGTLAGAATKVTDANASEQSAVKFGSSSTKVSGSYNTSGTQILDSNGNPVTLHGVSLSSTEWSCDGDGNFPASAFATMHNDWNANVVRIPLFQDMWLSGAKDYCSTYAANIANWIKYAQANNMIVILDLHWSDQGNLNYTPASSNQQCMADTNSNTFWQQVATAYKSNPGVWFELYNEPENISWSIWQNGGSTCGFNAVGMAQLYNTVRATGANNIVIAGGINYASHLDGVPVPIVSGQKNVVYAIHPYANRTGPDSWSNSDWDNRFGYLVENNKAPVIATEFGDYQCGGTTYDSGILNYFKAHDIGFTAWAWYTGGCSYPSLISDWAGDCATGMGCAIQTDMKTY